MGRNCRIEKEKLQLYYVMPDLYYGLKVDNSFLLWDEFSTHVKHYKKMTEVASVRFWSLILREAYQQAGIQVPD